MSKILKVTWCVEVADSFADAVKIKNLMCIANRQATTYMLGLLKEYKMENVSVGTMGFEEAKE